MTSELDRPILHALRTRQTEFAVRAGPAIRYQGDVSPFAAVEGDNAPALAALASLLTPGQSGVLLQAGDIPLPPGTVAEMRAEGVQMLADKLADQPDMAGIADLTDEDAGEMLELATLTRPGPFLPRTHRLGNFLGIRVEGRLAAMAGERMKLPGHTEVSGVCTHPDFRGQGFAGRLSLAVAWRIRQRGEVPFLHAFAHNTAAIRLYESLGFVERRKMQVMLLRRP